MENISFTGLISIQHLDSFAQQYLTIQYQNYLEKQLDTIQFAPQSGFLCFIYGHLYELGYKSQAPNYQQSFKYYQLGVTEYVDPLCAYRLAEIYSQPQSAKIFSIDINKNYAFSYLLISTLIELYYDYSLIQSKKIVRAILKELDLLFTTSYEIYQQFLKQFQDNTNIVQMGDTFLTIISYFFKSTNNQLHFYQDLILNCQKLIEVSPSTIIYHLFQIITHTLPTPNKTISLILQILIQKKTPLESIITILVALRNNLDFIVQSENDSEQLINQRRVLFDITLHIKNNLKLKYKSNQSSSITQEQYMKIKELMKQCYQILYLFKNHITKSVHQSLIIRNYGKIIYHEDKKQGLKILKEDLKIFRANKSNFGLIYYKLGKCLQEEKDQMIEKAQECFEQRVKDSESSQFDKLISSYYLSKVMRIKNDNKKELEQLKEIEDLSNSEIFSLVKTLQFQIIINKCLKRLRELENNSVEWNDEEFEIAMEQDQYEKISIEPIKYKIVLMNQVSKEKKNIN